MKNYLPATIEILEYKESDIDRIMADVVVNRNSQKGIIGKEGSYKATRHTIPSEN